MSNVEVILTALAAGATAGVTNTASAVVQDAYASLKSLLRPRLRGDARAALDTAETERDGWARRIGEDLVASGAADDDEVLAAADRLLRLTDPANVERYNVTVASNSGVVGGAINAPFTIQHGSAVPPAPPATA